MDSDEVKEYLAKIRKTIADSEALVEQANLRIQETDRFLAAQGLTREQVLKFDVTRDQRLAVNEELRRRGLPPIEDDDAAYDFAAATEEVRAAADPADAVPQDALEERRRKFDNFMQVYRL